MNAPALAVDSLTVRYGNVTAVDNVTFALASGEITGLIGPNGAGKTSLIDAISGFAPATGSVRFAGQEVARLSAYARSRRGLVRTFQSVELFDDLSVMENIAVGAARGSRRGLLASLLLGRPFAVPQVVDELLEQFGIASLADVAVRELSQGHQKLVAIVRALAAAPDVVLLDEPAAGLGARDSAWLGEQLSLIRGSGTTVLLVEHDMSLVLSVCTSLLVLDFGTLIARGPTQEVQKNPAVVAAYLGSTHAGAGAEEAAV